MKVEIEIWFDLYGPTGDQMGHADVLADSCWDDEHLHRCQQGQLLLPTCAVAL